MNSMVIEERADSYDLVIIPTYNEKDTIGLLVPEIFKRYPNLHILVVDDHSPDNTEAVVETLQKRYRNLKLLKRAQKTGLGDAYKDALTRSIKDPGLRYIITMDADGSHHPDVIDHFFQAMKTHSLAIGSRYMKGQVNGVARWVLWRRMLSTGGNMYAKILSGLPVYDLTSGYICINKNIVEKMNLASISSTGYAYQIEFKSHAIHHAGAQAIEVPIIFHPRRAGSSKMSRSIIAEGILTPLRLFFKRIT
jgi:dolichol-phosphate mannosyltransferase